MEDRQPAAAHARVEIVPDGLMPDGLNALWLEQDGEGIWAVREGAFMSVMNELNKALVFLSTVGLWAQRWGSPYGPPQQYRRVA